MARRRKGEAPQMRHHKASDQAYVLVDGKQTYLGPWKSPESRIEYRRLINRWELANRPVPGPLPSGDVSVNDLVTAFLAFASERYRRKDGRPTSELAGCQHATAALLARHPKTAVDDITGNDLRDLVATWKAQGLVRTTTNTYLARVKRMFRWGARRDLVGQEAAYKISLVETVAAGEASENDEIEPVPLRNLVKTLHKLKPNRQAMVRAQYYCGARPGEVCAMRGDEIKRGSFRVGGKTVRIPDGIVVFLPTQHKTVKKGQTVFYTLGPRAQKALLPWLNGDGFVFPGETAAGHVAHSTYALNITKAAERAGVAHWAPNRLRHNFMTRWDSLAGIEAASAAVRHKSLATTAIYIQRDLAKVGALAAKFG